jgi:hypothetical protein
VRVENDEMYGDWAHWLEAKCPACGAPLRAHHLHEFASLLCPACRRNPLLHFCGSYETASHSRTLTALLRKEELIPDVAADVAADLKPDAELPQFVEFLLSMHYVRPEALEGLVRKHAPREWVDGIVMTYDPSVGATPKSAPKAGMKLNLPDWEIGPELVKRVPRTVARVYRCVPVWAEGASVTLAVDDPSKVRASDIAGLLGCDVVLVQAPKEQIVEMLKTHYGLPGWQEALW